MAYQYPYGDTQQLNLAWFLDEFKNLQEAWEEEKQGITGALDAEIARAEAALSGVIAAKDQAAASAADALAYRNAAQSASQEAELSKTNAETARRDASNYAVSAGGSAQNASISATAAGNSAQLAEQARTTAIQQANAAVQAAGTASGYAQSAGQEAANAAASATAAAGSATTAGEEADRAEEAADEVADSVTQIATNRSDINSLKESINKIKNQFPNYVEFQNAGQRLSINAINNTNNEVTKILAAIKLTGAETAGTNMSIEVSAFAENGSVLYEQNPGPGNFTVLETIKQHGLYIVVTAELIGNICKVSYILVDKTTQSNKIIGEQIAVFSQKAKALRTLVFWHYMNGSQGDCYYQLNGNGNWQLSVLN